MTHIPQTSQIPQPPPVPQTPQVPQTNPEIHSPPPSLVKKHGLQVLLVLLGVTSLIAVISLLAGSWTDGTTKAILISLSSAFHVFIALLLVDSLAKPNSDDNYWFAYLRYLFATTIASFVLSVLITLEVFPTQVCRRTFECVNHDVGSGLWFWLVLGLGPAVLAVGLLNFGRPRGRNTQLVAAAGAVGMMLTWLLWLPVVTSPAQFLPEGFGRMLAALGIITTALVAATFVMAKMHFVQNPDAERAFQERRELARFAERQNRRTDLLYAPPAGGFNYGPPPGDYAYAPGDYAYGPPPGEFGYGAPQGDFAYGPPPGTPGYLPPAGAPGYSAPPADYRFGPPQGPYQGAPPQGGLNPYAAPPRRSEPSRPQPRNIQQG